jgi:hypothetical protein
MKLKAAMGTMVSNRVVRQLMTSLVLSTQLLGCRGAPPPALVAGEATVTPEYMTGDFNVQSVTADVEGEGPAEITLTVDGTLQDVCTQIDSVSQERMANLVSVHITTVRQKAVVCAQVLATHQEKIRLGTFADPGVYTIKVNGVQTIVRVGQITEEPVIGAGQTTNYTTPDATISIAVPSTWQVQSSPGSIVAAETSEALSPAETPPASRLSVTIITGPHRAMDFGIDGQTQREAFAYLVLTRALLIPAPQIIEGAAWPTLWGHGSSPATGDVDLRVISIDSETMVAALGQSPPGAWSTFEPVFQSMLASLEIH